MSTAALRTILVVCGLILMVGGFGNAVYLAAYVFLNVAVSPMITSIAGFAAIEALFAQIAWMAVSAVVGLAGLGLFISSFHVRRKKSAGGDGSRSAPS
ncbi:ABC-type siderophore export system fused ATPase/permease subunit [Microbacterium sp. SORGH_AS428]|uniref:hypothetical protein n=1 Tax=Microbacterium sp. SORGH_AS_0428 TaxID=3041788 RepID=UPI002862756E|nr:hypothetical protein [Microbacterium sp. SORGH_AS_0428]MDR6200727.1 ABC-type siderophore export system fused ATPase/permease subunit [Microbacterium sp. SORGH_AS_0428]